MGFFEKVKNMFTEEVEEDEVKVEKIDKVKKEIISSFEEEQKEEEQKDFSFKEEPKPVFFDDNDFDDLTHTEEKKVMVEEKPIKEEHKKREDKYARKGNYKESLKKSFSNEIVSEEPSEEEKKIFKPTPIISPVYGILDKNYHKEDIVSRDDRKNKNIEEPSIDQVRNKAYGTLEDELENTLFGRNSILFKDDDTKEKDTSLKEIDTDELDNITDDISKELDELLLKKKKNNSKQKSNEDVDDDLLNFIDSTLYKEEEGDE